ncbi:unnamed protein product [Heligmosomoides polygyrus]|uniref:Pyridoxamine 5'-phosphate oxidase family protein n=1 Tax=Heligmosomoides polygyrus TaxID=6339 RepID=A0A183GAI4_HELPZ|nr:unnamed protein product [Heligmosomoides polygyrus]
MRNGLRWCDDGQLPRTAAGNDDTAPDTPFLELDGSELLVHMGTLASNNRNTMMPMTMSIADSDATKAVRVGEGQRHSGSRHEPNVRRIQAHDETKAARALVAAQLVSPAELHPAQLIVRREIADRPAVVR